MGSCPDTDIYPRSVDGWEKKRNIENSHFSQDGGFSHAQQKPCSPYAFVKMCRDTSVGKKI